FSCSPTASKTSGPTTTPTWCRWPKLIASNVPRMTELGLRLTVEGAVARVVLDRPDVRNAQTPAMWRALAEFGTTLPADVRVVVVSGEGPSFSAGLDRRLMMGAAVDGQEALL